MSKAAHLNKLRHNEIDDAVNLLKLLVTRLAHAAKEIEISADILANAPPTGAKKAAITLMMGVLAIQQGMREMGLMMLPDAGASSDADKMRAVLEVASREADDRIRKSISDLGKVKL